MTTALLILLCILALQANLLLGIYHFRTYRVAKNKDRFIQISNMAELQSLQDHLAGQSKYGPYQPRLPPDDDMFPSEFLGGMTNA